MLAFLGFTRLQEMHRINALKNLGGATVSLGSLVVLLSTNLIDWKTGLIMAAGGTLGGYYSVKLTQKVSTHTIRIIVIIIGLGTAAYLILRNY